MISWVVVEFDPEGGIGQQFPDHAFEFQQFFLGHWCPWSALRELRADNDRLAVQKQALATPRAATDAKRPRSRREQAVAHRR